MQAQNVKELMKTATMAATMYAKRACTAVVKKSASSSSGSSSSSAMD
jgi:hypothetical protein